MSYGDLTNQTANLTNQAGQLYDQGRLSEGERNRIDGRLTQLLNAMERDAFDGGGLSKGEEKLRQKQLNQILKSMNQQADGIEPGKPAQDRARDDLGLRINRSERAGLITHEEAEQLRTRLEKSDNLTGLGRSTSLTNIEKQLKTLNRDGNIDRDRQANNFEARIAQGLKDGSLTKKEAEQLRAAVKDLAKLDGAADPVGTRAAYAKLSQQIWGNRHDPDVDLDQRRGALLNELAKEYESGKLSFEVYAMRAAFVDRVWTAYSSPYADKEVRDALGARLNTMFEYLKAH